MRRSIIIMSALTGALSFQMIPPFCQLHSVMSSFLMFIIVSVCVCVCVFCSPMKIVNRHNEVWFIPKGEPVCPKSE